MNKELEMRYSFNKKRFLAIVSAFLFGLMGVGDAMIVKVSVFDVPGRKGRIIVCSDVHE